MSMYVSDYISSFVIENKKLINFSSCLCVRTCMCMWARVDLGIFIQL